MATRRGSREGRRYWTAKIAKFERSGLSHEDFCERERLKIATFRYWLYKFRAEGLLEAPSFVELDHGAGVVTRSCVLRVGAAAVEFAQMPDAGYLVEVLSTLDTRRP